MQTLPCQPQSFLPHYTMFTKSFNLINFLVSSTSVDAKRSCTISWINFVSYMIFVCVVAAQSTTSLSTKHVMEFACSLHFLYNETNGEHLASELNSLIFNLDSHIIELFKFSLSRWSMSWLHSMHLHIRQQTFGIQCMKVLFENSLHNPTNNERWKNSVPAHLEFPHGLFPSISASTYIKSDETFIRFSLWILEGNEIHCVNRLKNERTWIVIA